MLTPRENYMLAMNHKPTEYVPCALLDQKSLFSGPSAGPDFEKGPAGGGYDGFGVRWIPSHSAMSAVVPAPNEFVLEDVTDWREKVTFPDLDKFDWETAAKEELADCDRTQVALEYSCVNGVFERLASLMGFENALISLAMEPEAVNDFFTALTDYKIEYAKKVAQYYSPDTFVNFDDIATERGLFMSPETYRTLIKPHHKRLYDEVRKLGMIPVQHTCGKADSIIEDFIEIGAEGWTSVQPTNDIEAILKNYGDKITINGGYDTIGHPARPGVTQEEIDAEVLRCMTTYGAYPGYIFMGFIMAETESDIMDMTSAVMPIIQSVVPYRAAHLGGEHVNIE